ncbi:MAG: YiiX family permuted papain-like enzyme [Acidobacteria bacterium]|nr:YiiX family permuted papain-like enzyme [Acidobacteriota bacterium]
MHPVRKALLALFLLGPGAAAAPPALQEGDLVFHTSRSAQSLAIQRATKSPFSHMGVVLEHGRTLYVLEAVSTVRETPLADWLARGERGRYRALRLADAVTVLTPDARAKLRREAKAFLGRRYDLTFEWSDDRIYCSELVYKLYDRALGVKLGEIATLRTFDLTDPAVKRKMRERYGAKVPLDEPVISPASMAASPRLVTVAER